MLAMERPRNFKLKLKHTGGEVADIGSNDEEFWIWTKDSKDSKDKAVYYCNYDRGGNCPLAGGLQPDWITEALGLRVIPDEEMDEITVTRGKEPDTLVLTHRPTRTGAGEAVTRVTILTESTRRVQEYQLWTGDRKTKLAQAQIKQYQAIVPAGRHRAGLRPPEAAARLVPREAGDGGDLRQGFDHDQPAVLRGVPRGGVRRADPAGLRPRRPGARRPASPTTALRPRSARRSPRRRPARACSWASRRNPPRSAPRPRRGTPRDPIALSADLPAIPSLSSQVVGAPIPRPPVPEFQGGNGRPVAWPSYER